MFKRIFIIFMLTLLISFVIPINKKVLANSVNWEICSLSWNRNDFSSSHMPSDATLNVQATRYKNLSTSTSSTVWSASSNYSVTKISLVSSGYLWLPTVKFPLYSNNTAIAYKQPNCYTITLPPGQEPFSNTIVY